MSATWADIQKLVGDLQRVQLIKGSDRLSEANCVEVISKLIKDELISVVFTCDGKEYITKKHLLTEMKLECASSGGRIPLTEIAEKLNIDLSVAEQAGSNLVRDGGGYIVAVGELLTREYIDDLCKEVNEKLAEVGQISVLNLIQNYSVPVEILNQYVLSELGKKVQAIRDGDQLYTNLFVEMQTNRLRTAMFGITRSVQLQAFHNFMNVSQSLFFTILNQVMKSNKMPGTIVGPKSSLKSLYVPHVQEKLVEEYVWSVMNNQQYILNSVLRTLNVPNPVPLFQKLFASNYNDYVFLPNVVISSDIFNDCRSSIEDGMKRDLNCLIDSTIGEISQVFQTDDVDSLVGRIMKLNGAANWQYTEGSAYIYDTALTKRVLETLEDFVKRRAESEAPNLIQQLMEQQRSAGQKKVAKDDDDDWNVGSGKGGKKKGAAKKGGKKTAAPKETEAVSDQSTLFVITRDDVLAVLDEANVVPSELMDELIDEVESSVNAMFKKEVEARFLTLGTSEGNKSKQARQTSLQKISKLYESFCMFEQGADVFDETTAGDLKQFLVKSIGNDIAVAVLSTFVSLPNGQLGVKARNECIASIMDIEAQKEVTQLFDSLSDCEKFHEAMQMLNACSIFVKTPEKKARNEFIEAHICELSKKLENENDSPTALLLAILLIVSSKAKVAVHASGKFVGTIVNQLSNVCAEAKNPVASELVDNLLEGQKLVIKLIKAKSTDEEDPDRIRLNEIIAGLKDEFVL